jgi:zinc/manganese transport system substrate-binding protein
MRYSRFSSLALMALTLAPLPALALNVFACEPEWSALVTELGGNAVSVHSATTAFQDPHRVEARPSLIAQVRRADLIVCTGAELEIGWLPMLLRQASNPAVQPGKPGYFSASDYVRKLEVPTRLDRAMGDIHPYGNPHIQTSPRTIAAVADALAQRLAEVDPANAALYRSRHEDFMERWNAAMARWEAEGKPLRGMGFVTHHKSWAYLFDWLGLKEVATLEPKPGIPPTSGHLAEVLQVLQRDPAKAVIRAPYQDERPSQWLSERAKIPAIVLPFTVGGTERAKDLFGLFDDTLQRLLEVAK